MGLVLQEIELITWAIPLFRGMFVNGPLDLRLGSLDGIGFWSIEATVGPWTT